MAGGTPAGADGSRVPLDRERAEAARVEADEEEALRIQKTGTMPSPVKAVLVIPNQIVEGLIQALEAQRERQAEGMKAPTGTSVQ